MAPGQHQRAEEIHLGGMAPPHPGRPTGWLCPVNHQCHRAEEETMQGSSPGPHPGRSHDVSGLTNAELERARRELRASLGLSLPGSAASVPILARLSAIETELAGRSVGCSTTGEPPGPGSPVEMSIPLSELR
jgi:hypothetical protein